MVRVRVRSYTWITMSCRLTELTLRILQECVHSEVLQDSKYIVIVSFGRPSARNTRKHSQYDSC